MRSKIIYTLFLLALVLTAIAILPLIKKYIGYVPVETLPGTITELYIELKHPAVFWHGFYGIVIMVPSYTAQQSALARSGEISVQHLIFPCLEPNKDHELYASTTRYPMWDKVVAATPQDVDNYLGINGSSYYSSGMYTFTQNITIELGARKLTIPGTYTRQAEVPNSTQFNLGILKDNLGNLIFVTKITDYQSGYNTEVANYQLMVAARNTTAPRYYFFTDPYDNCPAGIEYGLQGRGCVYGWVTDNSTGAFIDATRVMVEDNFSYSNINGLFNFSVPRGYHVIAAQKSGYNNYFGFVNVSIDKCTNHNISMTLSKKFETQFTGVGPGIGPGQSIGPGVGPGIGPGVDFDVGPYTEKPKKIEGLDVWISTTNFNIVLRQGTFAEDVVRLYNFKDQTIQIQFSVEGNASPSMKLSSKELTILPKTMANISVTFFGNQNLGIYYGSIKLGGDINYSVPVKLKIASEEQLPVEALLLDVTPVNNRLNPGDNLRYKVDLKNLLSDQEYDIYLKYFIKDINNTKIFSSDEDKIHLRTSYSILKNYRIPKNATLGDYLVQVDAHYLDLVTTGTAIFSIAAPFYKYMVFGIIPVWMLLLMLSALALIILLIIYIRKKIEEKKRFHVKVELDLLPQTGPRSIFVGKVAETDKKTYFDMDNLTVHTIVAGSTGGGKTISAQVIVEECLMKNIGVIVFDPTAQWSGYLRKCTDKKMMTFYPKFNLKRTDARSFSGNIRFVENPYEIIDVKRYMIPGNIQVFTLNRLDPKDIDVFVANTVREVFHMNLSEARELKLLLVYDEVHRLLPKFGGSGEGFIQIERACREFRKWGVGVMLISQVLADFVGQIKANINTEIQMKTRDEGDLNRIETKFGKGLIQSLVKSPVGSGMVQNAAYNRGNPYFIEFRPILHSVERLSDQELERYNKYNNVIDDIEYQIDQLEEHKIDVFDLRLELKLAKGKLQTGNFNMVDIYLEGITPRIKNNFDKLGIVPKKRTIKVVDRAALEQELKAAKTARAEYEQQNKPQVEEKKPEGPLKFDEDVPPEKILKLKNDMLVVNLKGLIDEVSAMKPEHYAYHVNDKKNDFADWIESTIRKKGLAKKVRETAEQQNLVSLLEDAYQKEKSGKAEPEEEPEKQKAEAPQQPKLLEEAQSMMSRIGEFIERKDYENATKTYDELNNAYKKLSKEEKASVAQQAVELRKKLDDLRNLQNLFSSESDKMNQMSNLLDKADGYLGEGRNDLALKTYQDIMSQYASLSPAQKKEVYKRCQDIHNRLTMNVVAR